MTLPVQIAFLRPEAAWLLVLLPLLWLAVRRRTGTVHALLRTAVFVALIAALAQPAILHRSAGVRRVFVLDQGADQSDAGRRQGRAALATLLGRLPRGDRATVIQLGGTADPTPGVAWIAIAERGDRASLSQALGHARDAIPLDAGGAVTLIGNGLSTDRHWGDAIVALRRRGIPVSSVRLPDPDRPAFVGAIRVAPVRVGETVRVTVAVDGDAAGRSVVVRSGARALARVPVGADGIAQAAFPAERAGFLSLTAMLAGGGDSGLTTIAAIQDPLPILYLVDRQAGAAPLLARLLGAGVAIDARNPATLAPGFDFARYRAVFLDDVPAARLAPPLQRRLARAVSQDGVGLVHTGGAAAFASGGWQQAPLATALPVTLLQDEQVEQPSIALAVIIDSSGSMAGPRLDLAKQVARATVRKLGPADSIGVVEFYGSKQWAVPMQPARAVPDVERAIGRMQAQGASMLFPALQEAYYGLRGVRARFKHILVISDGGVEEERYQQLLRHIADDRVNVSTVLVGDDASGEESMSQWARLGRGRFYAVADEFSLVALDFRQPQVKPAKAYVGDAAAVLLTGGESWWPAGAAGPPPLVGHARARLRPQASLLAATAAGDPIVASWQFGAGRVTAMMTEPLGAGTAGWRGWPGYGAWLGRIVARTARQDDDPVVSLTRRFDRLRIMVQRVGSDRSRPRVVLQGIDRVGLEERAPGLFVADLPFPGARVALLEAEAGGRTVRAADPAASDVRAAGRVPIADALPLAAVAAATRGIVVDPAAAARVLAVPSPGGWAASDLWPWLSLLALALYQLDILHRRWPSGRAFT